MPAMRAAIESELTNYLERSALSADWEAVVDSDDEGLVNTLACACPFAAAEKQALFEAEDLADRAELLLQIMQFATGPADPEMKETLQLRTLLRRRWTPSCWRTWFARPRAARCSPTPTA